MENKRVVTLLKPDGSELTSFDFPTHLSQVPLTRFIDFIVQTRAMEDDEPTSVITVMAKSVSAFLGIDVHQILSASAGVFGTSSDAYEGTISALYGNIIKLIGEFKPDLVPVDFSFEYLGEKYEVPTIIKQQIEGEFILPDLSLAEVIEVAEITRFKQQATQNRGDSDGRLMKKINDMVAQQIKINGGTDPNGQLSDAGQKVYKSEVEKRGDPDGSLMLTYYLKTLAVLCRKPGEQLPFEESVREFWIQNRTYHFLQMDAATALTIDFFLTSISKSYEERPGAVGFLKDRCFVLVAATRLKKEKRLKKRSTTPRKYTKRLVGVNSSSHS